MARPAGRAIQDGDPRVRPKGIELNLNLKLAYTHESSATCAQEMREPAGTSTHNTKARLFL